MNGAPHPAIAIFCRVTDRSVPYRDSRAAVPAMDSFFALVQKNVLNRRRCDSRDELRIAIVTWIERT